MKYIYDLAILGGTFDHFHKGHEALLDTAFTKAKKVIIGISKPTLYQHKLLSHFIESYETRENHVKSYLQRHQWTDRAQFIGIEDIYGNSLEVSEIDVIVVTKENLPAVKIINDRRRDMHFSPLQIEVVSDVIATDGEMITSERIRKGEIDRDGFAYYDIFARVSKLTLPEDLRHQLQKPLGTISSETKDVAKRFTGEDIVIAVGDIVSSELTKAGYDPAIRIIDQKNRRQKLEKQNFIGDFSAKNVQGTIQTEAVDAYRKSLSQFYKTKKSQTISIDGEEDLLALPAILFAPLGATVLYGQYGEGVVVNHVDESLKEKILSFLQQFHI
jgi:cytidyltransferase-like protein